MDADGKSVRSMHPLGWCQVCGGNPQATVTKRSWTPGESTKAPLTPSRRECRCLVFPVVYEAHVVSFKPARGYGCGSSSRHSLRPSRVARKTRTRPTPPECERASLPLSDMCESEIALGFCWDAARSRQTITRPPAMSSVMPVIHEAASESRNNDAAETSFTCPSRPSGNPLAIASSTAGG